jgi:predicted transcriptional regulator
MRFWSPVVILVCTLAWAGRAEAQDVRRQVQVTDLQLRAVATMDTVAQDLASLDASHAGIADAAEGLVVMYAELSAGVAELAGVAERLAGESAERGAILRLRQLTAAVNSLQQEMLDMNEQFLALQNQMQMESRQYNTVSNALKVRHDAAMSAIRNMK